jgi:ABC-2 type transport system permease protein
VLMLILQQTIALGIGMAAGTARERHRNGQLIPAGPQMAAPRLRAANSRGL